MATDLDDLLGISQTKAETSPQSAKTTADMSIVSRSASRRYSDAYLVARVTTGLGATIKWVGGIFGLILGGVAMTILSSTFRN